MGAADAGPLPHDLARGIDAPCTGDVARSSRIVEGGIGAAAIEEAAGAGGAVLLPDDLARGVDTVCLGATGISQRIVDGGVAWHDLNSSVIGFLANDVDWTPE